MLDLSTLTKFKSDIEGNHVTAYPILIIGMGTANPLYISTVKETILDIEYDEDGNEVSKTPLVFKDYNLKISNIKESINLESHVIKISNVNITLSNYEQDGKRLSDSLIGDFNVDAYVFYKTQSCTSMQDCLPLYQGTVRRIDHDDSTIKVTLEDLTDSTFHKDVPTANMGNRRNCFNKDYINRYIPMVYGEVEKAPVIPYIDSIGSYGNYYISIIADDVEDVTGSERGLSIYGFLDSHSTELEVFPYKAEYGDDGNLVSGNDKKNPLFIYKDDYFRVLRNYEEDFHKLDGEKLYSKVEQYKIDSSQNFLSVEKIYSSGFAQNPPAANEFQAVKMYYPSQAEILKTEADGGDLGLDGNSRVINIDTPIYNPDAAIDNKEKGSSFLDHYDITEFETYAQIPTNEIDMESIEGDLEYQVSGFRPSYWDTQKHGIYYPGEGGSSGGASYEEADWIGTTNYLWFISAWLQVNAHHMNKSVKFVSMPTGNMIRSHANNWIKDPANGFCDTNSSFRNDTYKVRVVPQYCLDSYYRDKWCEASGLSADETHTIKTYAAMSEYGSADSAMYNTNEGGWLFWHMHGSAKYDDWLEEKTHHYFPGAQSQLGADQWQYLYDFMPADGFSSNYQNLCPVAYSFKGSHGSSNQWTSWKETYVTNRHLLRGYVGSDDPCYYPTTVFKMGLEKDHSNNKFGLTHLYLGQWNHATMGEYSLEEPQTGQNLPGQDLSGEWRHKWINIFYDEAYPNIPYLYHMDDFAVFTPTAMISKQFSAELNGGSAANQNDELSIAMSYYADWNGSEINKWQGSNITWGNSFVSGNRYVGGYGLNEITDVSNHTGPKVKENELCDNIKGGMSWFLYIADEISDSGDKQVMTKQDDWIGEYTLNPPSGNAGTRIPRGCLIPCNHKGNDNHNYGVGWHTAVHNVTKGTETVFGDLQNALTVIAGSNTGIAESRLGILFPFSNISATDAIEGETKTFTYGKFEVNFPEDTGDPNLHNMSGDDIFLVQAYAAQTAQSDELNYNAEFVGDPDLCRNLIRLDSSDEAFTQNSGSHTKSWIFGDDNSEFNFSSIPAWDSPNAFDALSLVYRVKGTATNDNQAQAQMSTNIYSIGIIQFNQFENALNSDMYADIYGRANNSTDLFETRYKYTNNPATAVNDLIENPADIIYHFIEKELGQIDVVNRDSWVFARESSLISRLGFSITDKINSRKLIEDICKNTNLYPRFGNNGEFDFKFIQNEYSDQSVNMEIKQKDILKFSFTRTPLENVITMANVKFYKDYAKDEYVKSTGYCDAHDFFGNGDNGAEVLRYNGELDNSYEGYDYIAQGLTRESNILEFESDYIRDYYEAERLRNFLLMQNCNQHTIIKCTLPLKYINTEVGDVIRFDKLNNNTKAYGEDYTKPVSRNGQEIYPYFMITSISKSSKDIKIECMQLHRLERTFTAGAGSLSRRSELGLWGTLVGLETQTQEIFGGQYFADLINGDFTFADVAIFENILSGYVSYLTSEQKINADMDNNGTVNQEDINLILSYFGSIFVNDDDVDIDITAGDVSGDGIVNVVDIVSIISYILGSAVPTEDEFNAANVTVDETINVSDIVAIINLILGS